MSEKALLENMHVLPKQLEIKNFETLMQANNIDLSDVEKNNICILEIFGADYAELYKTLIFAYKNKQLPIRQSIIGHCVRELVEGLLQWNDEESKAEVINALMKVSFINSGQNTQEDVKKAISFDKVWPNIKGLRRIEIGLKNLLRQRRPQLIEAIEQQNPEAENIWRNLEQIGDNVQNFYRKVQGIRHLNCRFNTIEESEIEQGIEHVNQYINNLETDSILKHRDILQVYVDQSKKQQKPSRIDFSKAIVSMTSNGLRKIFFEQLDNQYWFDGLKSRNLLGYDIIQYGENTYDFEWYAVPYLSKIAPKISSEVFGVLVEQINRQELKDVSPRLMLTIVNKIGIGLNDEDFISLMDIFLNWLKTQDRIPWLFVSDIEILFKKLYTIDRTKFRELLNELLSIKTVYSSTSDGITNFEEKPKLQPLVYQNVLRCLKNIFKKKKLEYFCRLIDVYKESTKNFNSDVLDSYNDKLLFNRAAIEDHSQDSMHKNVQSYMLISEIRDLALEILASKKTNDRARVLTQLSGNNQVMLTRILLYIISAPGFKLKKRIEECLFNSDCFDQHNKWYYHEYYWLEKNKFNILSNKIRTRYLEKIKAGPQYVLNTTEEYITHWKYRRLLPIWEQLTELEKGQFNELQEAMEQTHDIHWKPDFLVYSFSSYGGFPSPIDIEDFCKKDIIEVIDFLNAWKQPDEYRFQMPTEEGLAFVLEKDVKQRPQEYLSNINLFKKLKKPLYINKILRSLSETGLSDVLLNFINWTLNTGLDDIERCLKRESVSPWELVHQTGIDIIHNLFIDVTKYPNTEENNIIIDTILASLKKLILFYVKTHNKEYDGDSFNVAMASREGSGLYAFWLIVFWKKHYKLRTKSGEIFITKLLIENSTNQNVCTICGRLFPWIKDFFSIWADEYIDTVYNERNSKLFCAAFNAYLRYTYRPTKLFSILYRKFLKAMDLLLKKEDIDLRLIDVLALYYGQGIVGLKDKLIRKLFSNTSEPSLQERFIRRIGIILSDRENGVISEDVVKRLVDLWGYRKKGLEGIENAHQKELAQFSLWYKSGKFDREWALQQLHYVVVKCEAEVSVWDVLEGLEQDVVISVEQVLEILYSLAKKDENIFEIKDKRTIENILSYINNEANEFLQKGQEFVNKFLCTRVYDFNYWTNALRDYKNN